MVKIFERVSIYIKLREKWDGERDGNELVLFHCSNDCQNDVILYWVEVPFFLQDSSF